MIRSQEQNAWYRRGKWEPRPIAACCCPGERKVGERVLHAVHARAKLLLLL